MKFTSSVIPESDGGSSVLAHAFEIVCGEVPNLELVVFGQLAPHNPPDLGFCSRLSGQLSGYLSPHVLYCAAEASVVTSWQPSATAEALVFRALRAAFKIGSSPNISGDKITGFKDQPFESSDLSERGQWMFDELEALQEEVRRQSREPTVKYFDKRTIAIKYKSLHPNMLTKVGSSTDVLATSTRHPYFVEVQ